MRMILCLLAACAALLAQPAQVAIQTPYVTTPHDIVQQMLSLAQVRKTDVLYDLGCGDGRIVIAAARKFGARGVGIDISPERIREARENARRAGVAHLVEFRQGDLFDTDLAEATVVTLYLLPTVNLELRPKLLRELRSGARVVSHSFDMGDWKPDRVATLRGTKIYVWVVNRAARASWSRLSARLSAGHARRFSEQPPTMKTPAIGSWSRLSAGHAGIHAGVCLLVSRQVPYDQEGDFLSNRERKRAAA